MNLPLPDLNKFGFNTMKVKHHVFLVAAWKAVKANEKEKALTSTWG